MGCSIAVVFFGRNTKRIAHRPWTSQCTCLQKQYSSFLQQSFYLVHGPSVNKRFMVIHDILLAAQSIRRVFTFLKQRGLVALPTMKNWPLRACRVCVHHHSYPFLAPFPASTVIALKSDCFVGEQIGSRALSPPCQRGSATILTPKNLQFAFFMFI